MSRVEVLATGIKIESKQSNALLGTDPKIAKKSIDQEHTAAIWLLTLRKSSTQGPQWEMIKQVLPIKSLRLDPGSKHLNRQHLQHASDYPLVLHCNKLLVLINR